MSEPSRALQIARARAAQAEANRAAFPFATAMVDRLREHFPDARVTYAIEPDGRELGKAWELGVTPSELA